MAYAGTERSVAKANLAEGAGALLGKQPVAKDSSSIDEDAKGRMLR